MNENTPLTPAPEPTRREFSQKALQSLLTFAFLDTLYVHDAFAEEIKPITGKWVKSLNDLAKEVKDEKIKQLEWQKKTEELLKKVDLKELLQLVEFDKLKKKVKYRDKGELSLRFKFKQIEGIPTKLVFGKQIFALKKGCSVVPHGHNNMATAFLILEGKLHGRHFDRVKDEKNHILIKPTIDDTFKAGQYSSVSDYKDNIHWFTAKSDKAFIFNFHVLGVDVNDKKKSKYQKRTGRVYLNPKGEKLKNGLILAPRINYKQAHKIFG